MSEVQQKVQQLTEDVALKEEKLQSLENENLELDRQRTEAEHHLKLKSEEVQRVNENNESILARMNAFLTGFSKNAEQHTTIDAALEALCTVLSSAKTNDKPAAGSTESAKIDSKPISVSTESQSRWSKPVSSINRQMAIQSPKPSTPDEVMLLGSQDGEPEQIITSPPKPSRKVNRHLSSKTSTGPSQIYREEMLIQESQVEETTIHRSVRKTTSSQGRDNHRSAETPSHSRNQKSLALPQFSQLHQSFSQSLDPESPLGDMRDFFPPTPILSSSHLQPASFDTSFDSSQAKSRTLNSNSTSQSNELPNSRHSTQTGVNHTQATEPNISRNRKVIRPTGNTNPGTTSNSQSTSLTSDTLRTTVPKGILKDSKGTKRAHTSMNGEPKGLPTRKKTSSSTRDLGPIIGESQSPSARARKTQKRKPGMYAGYTLFFFFFRFRERNNSNERLRR